MHDRPLTARAVTECTLWMEHATRLVVIALLGPIHLSPLYLTRCCYYYFQFYHCTDGQHTLITCPPGVIFEPSVGACVHADQTNRPNCSATRKLRRHERSPPSLFIIITRNISAVTEVLHFVCPAMTNPSTLRFGDHDRLAHPTSCRHFYMCLLTGMPRYVFTSWYLTVSPLLSLNIDRL